MNAVENLSGIILALLVHGTAAALAWGFASVTPVEVPGMAQEQSIQVSWVTDTPKAAGPVGPAAPVAVEEPQVPVLPTPPPPPKPLPTPKPPLTSKPKPPKPRAMPTPFPTAVAAESSIPNDTLAEVAATESTDAPTVSGANETGTPAVTAASAVASGSPSAASSSLSGASGSASGATLPSFDAAYLNNPKPPYPMLSKKTGEQGKVLLRVLVSAQGLPLQVQVHQGSSYPRLDEAASKVVWNWRFVPARRGNQDIEASVLVPIVFSFSSGS
jgi:protein TonB